MSESTTVADLVAVLRIKSTGFEQIDAVIGRIKKFAATKFTFDALKSGARWLAGLFSDVVEVGDQLDEMAQKTGVSVETLQELGYAAGQSGVSQAALGNALGKLVINMDRASHGGKSQAKAFRDMGVSVKNADGTLRDAGDVFLDMSAGLSKMKDGGTKARIVMDTMGRSGKELIPTFNVGRQRLEELRQEFRDSGAELDGPTAAAFGNFDDQMGSLKLGFRGLKTQLAVALLPTVLTIVRGMVAWFKANRDMIRQKVAAVAKVLAAAFKVVAAAIGLVLDGFVWLNDHWDQAKYAIYALVGALVLYEAATIAAGIASAISWALALWPLVLLAAAIALVYLAVQDLYTYFNGGESVFGHLVDVVKQYIGQDAVDTIAGAIAIIKFLFQSWWDSMKLIFEYISISFNIVKAGIELVWKVVKPIVDAIRDAVGYVDSLTNSEFNPFGGNFGGGGVSLTNNGGPRPAATGNLWEDIRASTAPSTPTRGMPGSNSSTKHEMVANITVNAAAGADADEIAQTSRNAFSALWDERMRDVPTDGDEGGGS